MKKTMGNLPMMMQQTIGHWLIITNLKINTENL